jgi:hypothetical protein
MEWMSGAVGGRKEGPHESVARRGQSPKGWSPTMTITVSTDDKRSVKALSVLATADRWQRGHLKGSNRPFFAIPSSCDSSRLYLVDAHDCTCPDHTNRGVDCCHMLAVRLWLARAAANRPARRVLCAGCTGTSRYHKAKCPAVRVLLVARLAV